MTKIYAIVWTCPKCATVMHDDIDRDEGPFLTCTCDQCGRAFDQDAISGLTYEEPAP